MAAEDVSQMVGSIPPLPTVSTTDKADRKIVRHMIRETVAGDFGRFDYAATGNKVVGCAWLTSLLHYNTL
jgi:hypothetical protein